MRASQWAAKASWRLGPAGNDGECLGRQAGRPGVEAENSLSLVSTSVPRNCRIK